MVWIAIAVMTTAAVLCVVWPLSKPRPSVWPTNDGDIRFYRDQIRAVELDVDAGLVGTDEAAASRAEIGRRLLAAAEQPSDRPGPADRRWTLLLTAASIILFIPAVGFGLYARIGSPQFGDLPLESRTAPAGEDQLAAAIQKIEAHLSAHPEDGRGFDLLAPIYLQLGRFEPAAHAYEQALRLLGETAARRAGYGQALMGQADGVVTADAHAAFEAAAKDDPNAPEPQFYLGLAALQDGDKARARTIWSALVAAAPSGASWVPMVQARLADLEGAAPPSAGPASAEGAGIAALPADQQQQAIRGMVAGLAARLAQNSQDRQGWLRLIRAYTVLGDKAKAAEALASARRAFASEPEALADLRSLAQDLGLDGAP